MGSLDCSPVPRHPPPTFLSGVKLEETWSRVWTFTLPSGHELAPLG